MWKRIRLLLWVVAAAFTLRACVLEPVRVADEAMAPALRSGDVGFLWKLGYGLRVPGPGALLLEWSEPAKGDLVVAAGVGDPPSTIVRRISAGPGERAQLEDGSTVELKPGEYFLLAEKGAGAMDSRKFGPVPRRSIVGKITHAFRAESPSPGGSSGLESGQPTRRSLQPVL